MFCQSYLNSGQRRTECRDLYKLHILYIVSYLLLYYSASVASRETTKACAGHYNHYLVTNGNPAQATLWIALTSADFACAFTNLSSLIIWCWDFPAARHICVCVCKDLDLGQYFNSCCQNMFLAYPWNESHGPDVKAWIIKLWGILLHKNIPVVVWERLEISTDAF